MRVESNPGILLSEAEAAFNVAVDDTLDEARRRAGKHRKTGRFTGSLQRTDAEHHDGDLVARVGSPLSSARVKELGGFMQSHQSRLEGKFAGHMRFRMRDTGAWVSLEAFRVAATPVVAPAGRLFPEFLLARLRGLRGRAVPRFSGPVETRSGPVKLPR